MYLFINNQLNFVKNKHLMSEAPILHQAEIKEAPITSGDDVFGKIAQDLTARRTEKSEFSIAEENKIIPSTTPQIKT